MVVDEKDIIIDYISGVSLKATPEEIESVQVFSKILVEDYGYPKTHIQTRPQFRVKSRPSDTKKEYPVDIAVFTDKEKNDSNLEIIVECKKKTRKDGLSQLKNYLTFSTAYLGVWFNGDEKLFLRKYEKDGKVIFAEIPNIPKYGQRIEDVGLFKRKDLKPAINLKSIFKTVRNYLAGNVIGATRDEVLAQQLINLIFCKIYDEKFTKPEDMVKFRSGIDEKPAEVADRIHDLFQLVKKNYDDVLDFNEEITIDSKSLHYVVGELQQFSLMDSNRDAIGDAFEVFIGHALKGGQGQFFTPRNVIKMIIEILDPSINDKILDPACGSGGFLVESLRYIWKKVEIEGRELNWPDYEIEIEKQKVAIKNIRGIDKDYFLSKVAKAYMALLGDGRGGVYCENSLGEFSSWQSKTRNEIKPETLDVIVTNPPFGSKIPITGTELLRQYNFGHIWKYDKKEMNWEKGKLKESESPQILFIERCLQLLKPGGKLGIVLPDGILGNDKLGYIREYLLKNAKLMAVIDVPIETFMPHTSTKTSVIILRKLYVNESNDQNYNVFMAIAETCGHTRRGVLTEDDDILDIPRIYKEWIANNE
ncbi:N-6 DNA methylase [Mammaliicoccus sp. E-M26]|uniref:restriction endonuclease subunit M n=1 Tax=Mammaliicoccus sp. E-M26 TaxID=2898686 RepID=UPI001EFADD42|nr:N-6 DNA methylase [Mammaliicoccus sp. E-M26]